MQIKHSYMVEIVAGLSVLAFLMGCAKGCNAAELASNEQIVNAIWKAEGGEKATYAFGIRSIPYKDIAEARQICLNSVRNNKKRWVKAGRPEDFITFMGRRYCPPKANPKNSNWVKNVKYWIKRQER